MSDIYQEYVDIQYLIRHLQEKQTELREQMEKELPEDGYKDERITVYWTVKKNWEYSDTFKEMERKAKDTLSKMKKEEEERGIAELEEKKQLTVKVK